MQAQDTPNRLIERQALAAQKMSAYIAGVQQSQAAYQRAINGCAPLREKRCGGILLRDVPRLQRAMLGRGSWLQRRRRAAHDACLAMIQLREAALSISVGQAHNA